MNDDLIARLRVYHPQAAAELTGLRDYNAALQAKETRYREAIMAYTAELSTANERYAALEAELDLANKQIAETGRAWTADSAALQATVMELREALEPFRREAFTYDPDDDGDDEDFLWMSGNGGYVRIKHLRQARAILEASESVDGQSADASAVQLSHYTDAQIASEYFRRAQEKLGDPRIGVALSAGEDNE